MHKIGGAHVQCMNNHSATFEYEEMKTLGVTEYPTKTPSKHYEQENVLVQDPKNENKYLLNVHKI